MLDQINNMAKTSVSEEPVDATIKISVGELTLDIGFNADSYERLKAFLEQEIKEDKALDGTSGSQYVETQEEGLSGPTSDTSYSVSSSSNPLDDDEDPDGPRPLRVIAAEITEDWKSVNFAAKPYLDAMGELDKITDDYYSDSALSVVAYFLSNARSWTGTKAKEIKLELKDMINTR